MLRSAPRSCASSPPWNQRTGGYQQFLWSLGNNLSRSWWRSQEIVSPGQGFRNSVCRPRKRACSEAGFRRRPETLGVPFRHTWHKSDMRMLVIGAGAVGGWLSAQLAAKGEDVTLVARGEQARAIRERGIVIRAPDGERRVPIRNVVSA